MSYISEHLAELSEIAQCIAMQFGRDCEVVLHDLTLPYDRTIVAIWNGHVTGRSVGGGGTNAGLEILRGTVSPDDQYHYFNQGDNGRLLCSSSKYFRENGKAVGSLCINYDITAMVEMQKSLGFLLGGIPEAPEKREVFSANIDELLETMLADAVADAVGDTGKTPEGLSKEEKVAVVRSLDRRGAFQIKKSVERTAEYLGITRFTIYNYLKEDGNEVAAD